jgi:bacterioferritin-associated ferredoxin
MYICVCEGVTESQIRDAVHSGAGTFELLKKELRISERCGTCECAAQCLLEEVREEMGERRGRPPLALVVSNR